MYGRGDGAALGHRRRRDSVSEGILPIEDRLPEYGEADSDFDAVRDNVFRDHDVPLLFDVSLDGIEDDSDEIHEQYRFANLHPRDWFVTFPDQSSA